MALDLIATITLIGTLSATPFGYLAWRSSSQVKLSDIESILTQELQPFYHDWVLRKEYKIIDPKGNHNIIMISVRLLPSFILKEKNTLRYKFQRLYKSDISGTITFSMIIEVKKPREISIKQLQEDEWDIDKNIIQSFGIYNYEDKGIIEIFRITATITFENVTNATKILEKLLRIGNSIIEIIWNHVTLELLEKGYTINPSYPKITHS